MYKLSVNKSEAHFKQHSETNLQSDPNPKTNRTFELDNINATKGYFFR